jgi:hypothetical protein
MTFEEFKVSWETIVLPSKPKEMRNGQSLMGFLAQEWWLEYERIVKQGFMRSGDKEYGVDCFYTDSIIDKTLEHLEKEWFKYPN